MISGLRGFWVASLSRLQKLIGFFSESRRRKAGEMAEEETSRPHDEPLWPLVQILGEIARRVEREEAKLKERDDNDDSQAA